jgi:hypothetical protein
MLIKFIVSRLYGNTVYFPGDVVAVPDVLAKSYINAHEAVFEPNPDPKPEVKKVEAKKDEKKPDAKKTEVKGA